MSCKALVLSEVFPPQTGGSGKWLFEIYRRQAKGQYVIVAGESLREGDSELSYPQPVLRRNLSMRFRGIRSFSSLCSYARQIRDVGKIARQYNVGILHAARPLSEGVVAWAIRKRYRIPYLCYVHGEDVAVATTSRELKFITQPVLGGAEMLIANSHFTAGMLQNEWGIDPSRIQVMHPGVDTTYFRPADDSSKQSRWKDRFVILTVGRLQQRKGHDTVIRAIPRLLPRFPQLLYLIAGEGEERSRLEAIVRELGVSSHVEFLGEVDDVELLACFQGCDVFVLANREIGRDAEGFGIVLLEAQACGKPVVAGSSGGTRDTLVPGKTGYLVDCKTPDELVQVLKQKLADEDTRKLIGERGRQHAVDGFDWATLGGQASKLFSSVGNV
ncbi:GDP-mannose-dependent alpha-(1-6)-phosphatidylinositol monomannoside mannosyltransferase [Roseimaritima multifibrata]|uniref:GDP-mannose-dependent alpha-(1-6)-phosphatidylinositol monomannoside mannosyltransferase n=1 Tax=Roseimaritima multifibrata TaxID=1930274 RepID=A0A517MN88_9BACT|nr:glycosyltransferase family 4 protein [Roseimaritima multifibrata]QDS96346.1 GDP-mannose-dependent alpha-(1-6)-phosphatidylinositol monomannoside mannosyltransferase [Roseimaritima multifibrata]